MDLADKYPPAESFEDDEPTVKVDMRALMPKVVIQDDEPTLPSMRNPFMGERNEKRYPGIGLLLCLGTGAIFWGTVLYFIFR